jgi:DNA gyrase subunit B
MYLGDTGWRGLHFLALETITSALPELGIDKAGHISVELLPDGGCRVRDDGRGTLSVRSVSAFSVNAFHGFGLNILAAVSRLLWIEARREGRVWRQEYERGRPVGPAECVGEAFGTGTTLTLWPDPEIFRECTRFDFGAISNRCRELAAFSPGVVIQASDRQDEPVLNETFHSPQGAADLLRGFNRSRSPLQGEVLRIQTSKSSHRIDLAIQWTAAEGERIWSYINGCPCRSGRHLTGFFRGLTQTLNRLLLRTRQMEEALPGEAFREGLTTVLFLDLPEPFWQGATKEQLSNPEAEGIVAVATRQVLEQFFKRHPAEARALGEHFVRLAASKPGGRWDPKVGRV